MPERQPTPSSSNILKWLTKRSAFIGACSMGVLAYQFIGGTDSNGIETELSAPSEIDEQPSSQDTVDMSAFGLDFKPIEIEYLSDGRAVMDIGGRLIMLMCIDSSTVIAQPPDTSGSMSGAPDSVGISPVGSSEDICLDKRLSDGELGPQG